MRLITLAVAGLLGAQSAAFADNVLAYHNSPARTGSYVVPGLTLAAAAHLHMDSGFRGAVDGHVYAQPLFWHPSGGRAVVIAATESDVVEALDAATGSLVWRRQLGEPVALGALPCGNIDPDGITGTPVIDPVAQVLYLDAITNSASGPRHLVFALSLGDGAIVRGWPLDVGAALAARGVQFSSAVQGERSALTLFRGDLYLNFAGNWGDCGNYRGTVLQIHPGPPQLVAAWQTRARGGGIWAQGGLASDGQSLYATTGNTFGAQSWSDGEAIVRLEPGLAHSDDPRNFFTPANWKQLDDDDADLGGTEALPLDIPGASRAARIIAFGKDGNAYLADRTNLGGVGHPLAIVRVSNRAIITAPAIWPAQDGVYVALTSFGGSICRGPNETMLKVTARMDAPIVTAWCAKLDGRGAPIVTTSDGRADAIVWVVGAEGDNLLHAFDAHTGRAIFDGGNTRMAGLHHFVTIVPAEGRLYIAADKQFFAFAF